MSQTSNAASQVIALPKGGGALNGIGEKFAPDLYTGTGNFTVPITLPPGRNGFQPELSLVYSTGHGNGPYGLGWSLSVPGVARQTSKGVPRYDDATDVFVLSGAEDLVPVPGGPPGATRYRPRTEGLFARIDHHRDRDANHDFWEVRSKDGLVSRYGTPGAAGADPAAVAAPTSGTDPTVERRRIFAWKLTSTVDSFGNRIEYRYERDEEQTDGPHHWDQLYLSEIRYVDHGDPDDPQFLVTVRFDHEDRPDPFSDYRAGFEIRTVRRCTQIQVFTHAGDAETLTRSYKLIYLDDPRLAPQRLPLNGVSLLGRIVVTGHDGPQTQALPPLEFGYTSFEPERRDFMAVEGPDTPPGSMARPDYELADLIGNGLPDVLEMNGTVRYWRNLGGGHFDRPRPMPEAPAGLALADRGVQLLDADGDGRLDLMVTTGNQSGYFPMQFGGLFDRRSFQPYEVAPSFDLEDPKVRLIDLDGDGVTDAIRSGARLECFFNDRERGWTGTRRFERKALAEFPNVNFSDPRVKLADMTGDGLTDIVYVSNGSVAYWPNLGRGAWAKRVTMANSPRFPFGHNPERILLADLDGDGPADIVYVDDGTVTLWVNQGGNRWSDPIVIGGTPRVSDTDAVRLTDFLGTGVSGVLWTADATGLGRTNMFFLDLTGEVKPYLLNVMDNCMGSITQVTYVSSTRFYLEDERDPRTRWQAHLPFPVQVVHRVEAIDAMSGGRLTTEYSYHHGCWDGHEREFRGFGRVDQCDTEVFADRRVGQAHPRARLATAVPERSYSPPTQTRTWFHLGAIGDGSGGYYEADYGREFWPEDPSALPRPHTARDLLTALPPRARRDALRALRGSALRTELYALDGSERADRPYIVTELVYGLREEVPPPAPEDGRTRIFFPHPVAKRTTQWERGADPMTQVAFTGDYDAYGQPRTQTTIAVPRGRDYRVAGPAGSPYLATHTVTDYAQRDDADRYLVGRPARVTSYEIVNDGSLNLLDLYGAVVVGSAPRHVFGQTLNLYDGKAFEGLPLGQLGDHGVLVRSEALVLTEETLREAYSGGLQLTVPPELPPYLAPGGSPVWTEEYPQEFRDLLPSLGGYVFRAGDDSSAAGVAPGYHAITERRRYDCQNDPNGAGRGLLLATRDPLGRETTITYDAFDLLPVEVTDPAGLTTRAVNDYRVLQAREVTEPNGNRGAVAFTPLGLVAASAIMGKAGETVGDTPETPGTRMTYDLTAFTERAEPISVHTVRRVHHVTDTDVPPVERDETIETVAYFDGFGRQLQTRSQAEDIAFGDPVFGDAGLPADQAQAPDDAVGRSPAPGTPPRVVVSGRQVYDNKGREVEKFEPYFATGFGYAAPGEGDDGQKAVMSYDPRGQVVRTVNPDGSEQRVVFGVPADLADPEAYAPTPWVTYTYDANDNAGRTHAEAAAGYQSHWNTPASIEVDALGRTVRAVARNGPDPANDWFTTGSTYDIRGNPITVTDALGRVAFRHVYDLANRALRVENIDAGVRRTVLDASGNPVEDRDSKGALILHAYDVLNRPIRLWAGDRTGQALTLRERIVYGDAADSGLTTVQAAAANLLGKPYRHYDEGGLLTVEAYDFKGNVLEKVRQVIGDAAILAVFDPPPPNWQVPAFRVDWQPASGTTLDTHANGLLDATPYRTSVIYDALNRIKTMGYPQDVDGERRELRPRYNRAGALERIELNGQVFVEHIAYNAKGQRVLIPYGNGVMTRYAYDPKTFRLLRLHTECYTKPDPLTYHPTGAPLQDFAYGYDLAGNITAIRDRTPESGVPNTLLGVNALDRDCTYDPLYRLLSATGRECDVRPPEPWDGRPRITDLTRARMYGEGYRYDPEGNVLQLQHQTSSGGFTRNLALVPNTNRLSTVTIGETVYDYAYDPNGNLIRETTSHHFEWDQSDRMRVFRTQAGNAEPSVHAHYFYDAAGQRVKKLVRKQGGQVEVTVYIDDVFEYHRSIQTSATLENNTLHVMDDQSRIALVRVGSPFPDDATPAVKFHFGDHLGSSNVVVDDMGAFINREEYTPYGETSFGSFGRKRYRFTGKERDEESGLSYHEARYYVPWLGRWMNCDPAGPVDGLNLYRFVRSNPLRLADPDGRQSAPAGTKEKSPPASSPATPGTSGTKGGPTADSNPAGLEITKEGMIKGFDLINPATEREEGVFARAGDTLTAPSKADPTKLVQLDNFMGLAYYGDDVSRVKWLQFAEAEVEQIVGGSSKPGAIPLKVDVADPKAKSPFYESARGLYIRTSNSLTIFDRPTIRDPKTGKEFSPRPGDTVKLTRTFHAYLVRDDQAVVEVVWKSFETYTTGKIERSYEVESVKEVKGLPERYKTVLEDDPRFAAYKGKLR